MGALGMIQEFFVEILIPLGLIGALLWTVLS